MDTGLPNVCYALFTSTTLITSVCTQTCMFVWYPAIQCNVMLTQTECVNSCCPLLKRDSDVQREGILEKGGGMVGVWESE